MKTLTLRHICEVCGKTEDMTSQAGFEAGWDYPPRMGAFGILSARTCPACPITETLWWRFTTQQVTEATLTDQDRALLHRVASEPISIMLTN